MGKSAVPYLGQFVKLKAFFVTINIYESAFDVKNPIVIFVKGTRHLAQKFFKFLGFTRFNLFNVGLEFGQFCVDDLMTKFSFAMIASPVSL